MTKFQPIGPRIKRNYKFLKLLSKIKEVEKRKQFIKQATPDEILAICEICFNNLNSNFCLNRRQKSKLIPHADFVRRLSRSRSPKSAIQIVQKGDGFAISSLLVPIL